MKGSILILIIALIAYAQTAALAEDAAALAETTLTNAVSEQTAQQDLASVSRRLLENGEMRRPKREQAWAEEEKTFGVGKMAENSAVSDEFRMLGKEGKKKAEREAAKADGRKLGKRRRTNAEREKARAERRAAKEEAKRAAKADADVAGAMGKRV